MAHPSASRLLRKAPLCASLCLALALGPASLPLLAAAPPVENCGDGGPGSGSLRDAIANASSGETIDLSQLPAKCAMTDAVITLTNGEIPILQPTLKLQGPSVGSVTIEPAAGSQSRVFNHTGNVELAINDLTIANGNVQAGGNVAYGGCIRSDGTVFLSRATVKNCTASGGFGYGGGIYTSGAAILLDSKVSGNKALGSSWADGGGVYARYGLSILYSTLSDNQASGSGGAVFTSSVSPGVYTYVANSTLEGNTAARCGGAGLYTTHGVTLSNSTISGNTATGRDAGLCIEGGSGYVVNSTIAFNTAPNGSAGLLVLSGHVTLQSSIIARSGAVGVPDLYLENSSAGGGDNLIMSWSGNVPSGVIKLTSDPKLDPQLRFNGGRTRTHMLLPGSPAIGAGNDNAGLWTDQRGRGYPRYMYSGGNYLIDIGAVQFDSIFFGDFDE